MRSAQTQCKHGAEAGRQGFLMTSAAPSEGCQRLCVCPPSISDNYFVCLLNNILAALALSLVSEAGAAGKSHTLPICSCATLFACFQIMKFAHAVYTSILRITDAFSHYPRRPLSARVFWFAQTTWPTSFQRLWRSKLWADTILASVGCINVFMHIKQSEVYILSGT